MNMIQTQKQVSASEHKKDEVNDCESLKTPVSLQNRYRFVEQIGCGSQGKIFKATRLEDHSIVAIKQLNIHSIKNWKEYDLFHREADILESLNINGVARFDEAIDCLEDESPCSYIVQEYISGVSLQQMINDGHRFAMSDVYDILIQILEILDKLHHHDPPVIHRDIKPSNLMISQGDERKFKVTLIDFGAVANPQVQGGGSTVAGTFGYMPPEQLMGKPVPASDVYAVAALAVALFSGKNPADIPTKDFRLIFEPVMQDKPHELVTLLRSMLEPKVEERWADIPEIVSKLNDFKNSVYTPVIFQSAQKKGVTEDKEYNDKLLDLRFVGEPGNVDLWQQLPDDNRGIPAVYSDWLSKSLKNEKIEHYLTAAKSRIIFIAFWAFIVAVLLCLAILFQSWPLIFVLIGFFVIMVGYVWFFLTAIQQTFRESNHQQVQASPELNKSIHEQLKITQDQFEALFKTGRKGLATIVGFEYIPTDEKRVIQVGDYYKVTSDPCFRVFYKFNPPDDQRTEDIIHQFITHTEPENHYRINDPLPILYKINDNYFSDTVYSMPYPVPLNDFNDIANLMDESVSYTKLNYASDGCGEIEEQFIYDVNHAENMQDLNKVIQSLNVPRGIQVGSYQVIVRIIGSFLCERKYYPCHEACIKKLSEIRYPVGYGVSCTKPERIVMDDILRYIQLKPYTTEFPSPGVIKQIFQFISSWRFYMPGSDKVLYAIPDDFWEAMIGLFVDDNVSPEVKSIIAEKFKFFGPKRYLYQFLSLMRDYDYPNKEQLIREAEDYYVENRI